jgi:hypothetical protein
MTMDWKHIMGDDRDDRQVLHDILLMLLGLSIMSVGTSMSALGGLGATPLSTLPYVLSEGLPLTFGFWTSLMHIVFILIELAISRRVTMMIALQIPVVIFFGAMCDITLTLMGWMTPDSYILSWVQTLASICVMSLGIAITVKANISFRPSDGLVETVSLKTGKDFGICKLGLDITVVLLASVASILLFGFMYGVREGSLAAMLLTGPLEKVISKRIGAEGRDSRPARFRRNVWTEAARARANLYYKGCIVGGHGDIPSREDGELGHHRVQRREPHHHHTPDEGPGGR